MTASGSRGENRSAVARTRKLGEMTGQHVDGLARD